MKRKIFLILTFLLMLCESVISQQTIKDIYEFVIKTTYEEYIRQKYITTADTLFVRCQDCSLENERICNDEELYNLPQQIQFGKPTATSPQQISISYPKIYKSSIVITVFSYWGYTWDTDINAFVTETDGGIWYYFEYSKRYKKYICIKKQEFGI